MIDELRSEPMPMDVEAAVAVIRERNLDRDNRPKDGEYLLDLSNAYIFNANFSHTSLTRVNFSDSVMANCIFNKIDLSESNFVEANLSGSSVFTSNLKGAHITQEQINALKEIDEKTALCPITIPVQTGSGRTMHTIRKTESCLTDDSLDCPGSFRILGELQP